MFPVVYWYGNTAEVGGSYLPQTVRHLTVMVGGGGGRLTVGHQTLDQLEDTAGWTCVSCTGLNIHVDSLCCVLYSESETELIIYI